MVSRCRRPGSVTVVLVALLGACSTEPATELDVSNADEAQTAGTSADELGGAPWGEMGEGDAGVAQQTSEPTSSASAPEVAPSADGESSTSTDPAFPDGATVIDRPSIDPPSQLEPIDGVLRPRQTLIAAATCENRDPELTHLVSGRGTICSVSGDTTVRCTGREGDEPIGATSAGFGTPSALGVTARWVSIINSADELWLWSLVPPLVELRVEGKFWLVDGDYSLDQFGRLARWTLIEGEAKEGSAPEGVFTHISSFDGGICALDLEGEIHCFADGSAPLPSHLASPPMGPFEQLSPSTCGSCGIRDDGQVQCWADAGEWGELNGLEALEIDTASCAICVKLLDGEARCWEQRIGTVPAQACEAALNAR